MFNGIVSAVQQYFKYSTLVTYVYKSDTFNMYELTRFDFK